MKKQIESIRLEEIIHIDNYYTLHNGTDVRTNLPVTVRSIDRKECAAIANLESIVQEEIKLLREHLSRSIIHVQEIIATQKNIYIVYEACNLGLLEKELKQRSFYDEETAVLLLEQVMDAYDSLLKGNVVVRSFRLDSFLVSENNILKLFDIGLIRNMEKFDQASPQPSKKVLQSLAPEIFLYKTSDYKSDIWGIGLIYYQLLFGQMPWPGETAQDYYRNVCTRGFTLDPKFQQVSAETLDFLQKTLVVDPNNRASWMTVRNHSLFATAGKSHLSVIETELKEKLRTHPDSWQAKSMMFNADPLVSSTNLRTNLRSSFLARPSSLESIAEDNEMENSQTINSLHQSQMKSSVLSNKGFKRGETIQVQPSSFGMSSVVMSRPQNDMLTSMSKSVRPQAQTTNYKKIIEETKAQLQSEQQQAPNMMQSAIVGGLKREPVQDRAKVQNLDHVFERYKEKVLFHVEKYYIYSTTATSACKLFKTDLILIQCYFFYKKFCLLLQRLYDRLLSKENFMRLPHWEAFTETEMYFKLTELVAEKHATGCEIFDKLLADCRKQLQNGTLQLDALAKYINEDFEDVNLPFDSLIYSYLKGLLENKQSSYDGVSTYYILKHKIEVADCLLMNKLPDIAEDDLLFDFAKHKAILNHGTLSNMQKYYDDKKSKLELLRYGNFSK